MYQTFKKLFYSTEMFFQVVAVLGLLLGARGSLITGRIVNGTDAQPGGFPFMVSLREYDSHICGATILNDRYVLTAAHCVQGNKVSAHSIQYGLTRIISGENAPNVIKVSKVEIHEDYSPRDHYINSVAVVQLENPLPLGPNVQPVKLPIAFSPTPGNASAVLLGWGSPYSGGSLMQDLQEVDILVYTDVDCAKALSSSVNTDYQICAGVPEGGKGQCSGDSGGPLLVNGVQVGISTWSVKPCGRKGYPGVSTKVSSYILWIVSKTILS